MDDASADAGASGRRARPRGSEAVARSAALERLRAIRGGGARAAAAVQVKMEAPIYDTVGEEDYAALVARRRKDVGAFIVDDDGLGYVDDGREEDWTHPAIPSSDEGSDGEDCAPRKRKPRPPQSKRPPQQSAAAASLSAAAAMMGKQRLSSMFTSSVFKKPGSDRGKDSSLAADSIVDDVIAEFAPDENDREERRRRRVGTVCAPSPVPPSVVHIKAENVAVDTEVAVRLDNGIEAAGVPDHENDMDVEMNPGVELEPRLDANPGCSADLVNRNNSLEELKQEANGEVDIEKVHRLNAKIKAEDKRNGDIASATAGWMKICGDGENAGGEVVLAAVSNTDVDESSEFELKDGALPFYILDAYEEPFGANSGTIYLFGKVELGKRFHSCCVVVKNMQRCIYAIPTSSIFPRDAISRMEKNSTTSDSSSSLRATLHDLASGLKSEIADKLSDLSVSNFVMTPVKRNYAFERTDLPNGEQYVLKINYPYKDPVLPSDLRGEQFHALLGTNNSALEVFLIKRKIKGPSWLSISKFVSCPATQRIDGPMCSEDWQKRGMLSHFTVMRKLEGIMSCIAGRLLCDTYLCSRDLLKEVSYSLTQLAETQLKKDRREVSPHDIPLMFQSSGALLKLVEYGETDAYLSLELMFHLSVIPLTRQLTNISGNLWGKTLQGARAQRVEYLLLHAFHAKKFIVPDKFARNKEFNSTKRKMNPDNESANADDAVADPSIDDEGHHGDQVKTKKGPSYAGGLVLEPKKGLYDKYVVLLDFNSLYPSIIQEYNICFTTVEHSSDGNAPNLPASKNTGVLPELLRSLVERRRMVKSWLKTASGLKRQQFDIQQQALKLTANSMYGCLGFSNSRFYAKPLAELITLQGREILQNTVDLVQNNLNLEVIYGDTDSIMIHTGLDDISRAKGIAGKVIQENIERKGLDMVRRDWSLLSKEIGNFCLNQILSGETCDDVIELIHRSLVQVQEQMRGGQTELEKYIITKSLTKAPEDYPDAKNQPHVQVALRLKQNGYSGCSAGDTVPYIICTQQDSDNTHSVGIAQRARHPEELKRDPNKWMIDIDYYLSQQIHPVVSRLCASIQGTSPARLAECLGLDSSKFQSRLAASSNQDTSSILLSVIDDEDERYCGCEPLRLSCPSCSTTFECPPISSLIASYSTGSVSDPNEGHATVNFWHRMRCPRCPDDIDECRVSPAVLANQMKRQADNFINLYYKGLLMCDDEGCKYSTHSVNLRVMGDSERGTICPNYPCCNGRLVRQLDQKARLPFEKEFVALSQTINLALMEIQKIRDRCAFGWVQLKDLAISI
ncbi:hypothetical protein GUJ93_ZPchr0001g30249 [Zizania palustris]|uniref:DNA polymerase n=1 Tax=Zizania palustris TaxID=103762 RepID=A0A8J5RWB8_ZIZPA|nr:hypothetical protein GUJ93_ZPchr0001g30249 [Zizania palustris]